MKWPESPFDPEEPRKRKPEHPEFKLPELPPPEEVEARVHTLLDALTIEMLKPIWNELEDAVGRALDPASFYIGILFTRSVLSVPPWAQSEPPLETFKAALGEEQIRRLLKKLTEEVGR
jgi:hypothetical protein